MAAIFPAPARPAAPPTAIPRWTALAVLAALAVLWLVTMEGSLISRASAGAPGYLHELFHDGRHLLGVPCH